MESKAQLLDLMIQPGFTVKDHTIIRVNRAAQGLLLEPGQDIRPLLATGREEYARFTEGCLYLLLDLGDKPRGAVVIPADGYHLFLMDQAPENRELYALALAAQSLRLPMSSAMIAADQISAAAEGDAAAQAAGQLNRGLEQLLRIINNMSDALLYTETSRQEVCNLSALFEEIFEKARALLSLADLRLTYQGPSEDIFCPADSQQLERAVLNILSNAAKFTPAGGCLTASLTRRNQQVLLRIEDTGPGIREDILGQIFQRYLRRPCVEDSRFGIGLGMALIRAAAANHGGTVLVDQPGGARITMTISLEGREDAALRSPVFQVDYAGGLDHARMELAEILPSEMFQKK